MFWLLFFFTINQKALMNLLCEQFVLRQCPSTSKLEHQYIGKGVLNKMIPTIIRQAIFVRLESSISGLYLGSGHFNGQGFINDDSFLCYICQHELHSYIEQCVAGAYVRLHVTFYGDSPTPTLAYGRYGDEDTVSKCLQHLSTAGHSRYHRYCLSGEENVSSVVSMVMCNVVRSDDIR